MMFGSSLSLFKVNIVAFKYLSKQWHLLSVQARKKTNRLIIPGIIRLAGTAITMFSRETKYITANISLSSTFFDS